MGPFQGLLSSENTQHRQRAEWSFRDENLEEDMVGEDRACLEALGGMHGWPPPVTPVHGRHSN